MSDARPDSELADKINKLFDIMRKPSTKPLSNAAAAEAITAKTGVSISAAYLWQLRSGLKTNPTLAHLQAIASFFGVPPSYLVNEGIDENIEAQLRAAQIFRDAGIRDLAARGSGLTPASLENIMRIVDQVRQVEGLPPIDDPKTGDKDD